MYLTGTETRKNRRSDLHLTIEDVLQDGDKVVVRSTITGTHRGALLGMPAKGRRLSMLRQLGVTGP